MRNLYFFENQTILVTNFATFICYAILLILIWWISLNNTKEPASLARLVPLCYLFIYLFKTVQNSVFLIVYIFAQASRSSSIISRFF